MRMPYDYGTRLAASYADDMRPVLRGSMSETEKRQEVNKCGEDKAEGLSSGKNRGDVLFSWSRLFGTVKSMIYNQFNDYFCVEDGRGMSRKNHSNETVSFHKVTESQSVVTKPSCFMGRRNKLSDDCKTKRSSKSVVRLKCNKCKTLKRMEGRGVTGFSIWYKAAEELYRGNTADFARRRVSAAINKEENTLYANLPQHKTETKPGCDTVIDQINEKCKSAHSNLCSRFPSGQLWKKAVTELCNDAKEEGDTSDTHGDTENCKVTAEKDAPHSNADKFNSTAKSFNSNCTSCSSNRKNKTHKNVYRSPEINNSKVLGTFNETGKRAKKTNLKSNKSVSCTEVNCRRFCNSNRKSDKTLCHSGKSAQPSCSNSDTLLKRSLIKTCNADFNNNNFVVGINENNISDNNNNNTDNNNKIDIKSLSDQQVLQFYENHNRKINKRIMNGKDGYRMRLHNLFSRGKNKNNYCSYFYSNGNTRSKNIDNRSSKSESDLSKLISRYDHSYFFKDYKLTIQEDGFVDAAHVKMDAEVGRNSNTTSKNKFSSSSCKLNKSNALDSKYRIFSRYGSFSQNNSYKVTLTCSPALMKCKIGKSKANVDTYEDSKCHDDGGQLYCNRETPVFLRSTCDDSKKETVCPENETKPTVESAKPKVDVAESTNSITSNTPEFITETETKKLKKKEKTNREECTEDSMASECTDQSEQSDEPYTTETMTSSSKPARKKHKKVSPSEASKSCPECNQSVKECSCDKSSLTQSQTQSQSQRTNKSSSYSEEKKSKTQNSFLQCKSCKSCRDQSSEKSGIKITLGAKSAKCPDQSKGLFCCCCQPDCSFKESLKKVFCISLPNSRSSECRSEKKEKKPRD